MKILTEEEQQALRDEVEAIKKKIAEMTPEELKEYDKLLDSTDIAASGE